MAKHLPIMWETRAGSLGWEDPLEKAMATHSSTLAWKIPWTEEPGGLQSMRLQRVGHDWASSLSFTEFKLSCVIISSGPKERKTNKRFKWLRLRKKRKKGSCPFLLLENPRPLSPWVPLDFLSTCLGIDSLTLSISSACELHENTRPEREKTLSKCYDDWITVEIKWLNRVQVKVTFTED